MTTSPNANVPGGTRVVNTDDAEPGTVLNGYAYDPAAGGWTEYEVETRDAIEIWAADAFMTMDDIDAARRDAGL